MTETWAEIEASLRERVGRVAAWARERIAEDRATAEARTCDALDDVLTGLEMLAERSDHPDARAGARSCIMSLAVIWAEVEEINTIYLGGEEPGDNQPTAEPEPFFEPGKTYRTENRAFEFTCERVVDGVALGREVEFDPRWNPANRRAWHSVMPEGCWAEIAPRLNPDDVRIDTFSSMAGRHTRYTHLPTGVAMTADGGVLADSRRAMDDLAELVAAAVALGRSA